MQVEGAGGVGPETVYGTHEDSHIVMSEKVQSLAGSIYQEFERMIARYDEDVVKSLMPLLVNVLECLDAAYQANQEQDVELELLREDNEQLVTQYEREKGARKASEQKLLEYEDSAEGERKDLSARLESLESIVRMLEIKHKNSMEHAGRLEEREGELKKEYAKLHERYTELFKTHMDYMERTKLLMSGQQMANERAEVGRLGGLSDRLNLGRSSGPISYGFASLEGAGEGVDSVPTSPISSNQSSPSLHSELDNNEHHAVLTVERSQATDSLNLQHKSMVTSPVSPPSAATATNNNLGRIRKEQRSGNTLYQELSFQDTDALGDMDDGADITGGWVHPGEYASSVNDNFFGMGKEVENLIMENNELLATKNALNVVKDDLIVKVDELSGEVEMLREEIYSLSGSREKLRSRIVDLEEELRRIREANESRSENAEEEADVPMAQRKRFTRVEMARVLMERNQYKERFMELQEAVRWTEMIRASRNDTVLDKRSRQGIWKFFSNLFSSADKPRPVMLAPHLRYRAATDQLAPGVKHVHARTSATGTDYLDTELGAGSERVVARRAVERREQYRQVRAHVRKDDGRLQAYGWSLPGKISAGTARSAHGNGGGVPVPVPVYCRPLAESAQGMKICCAAGVNQMGGYTKDGGLMVGGSVFYYEEPSSEPELTTELDELDKEISATHEAALLETKLSSLVWICTSAHSASIVTVIDANNPADILDTFGACANYILCIASIPGANSDDYHKSKRIEETNEKREETKEDDEVTTFVEDNPTVYNKRDDTAKSEEKRLEESVEESSESNAHETLSSVLATMWLGAQNGTVYVHSAIANWNQCLHSVKLADSVLAIVHVSGDVVVALANGTLAVFKRDADGQWDLSRYHVVRLGVPQHSVRCLATVADKVWCGYRNTLHVLDPRTLAIVHSLEAHPRKESQVKQLAWLGEGVWVSIRLDSTLRLYHSQTYQHLQDVDIEPYVSKMLGTGKLGFSFVRITSLLISSSRLWIGTGNGVIISVPLSDGSCGSSTIVSRTGSKTLQPPCNVGCVPYCTMAHAQLSFHGHRDAVKFFVAVPGSGGMSAASTPPTEAAATSSSESPPYRPPAAMLVVSGGEGYIDFRIGDGEMEDSVAAAAENGDDLASASGRNPNETVKEDSHLIVWQVATTV